MPDLHALAIVENPPAIWERWRIVSPYWRLRQLGYDFRAESLDEHEGVSVKRGDVVVLPRQTVGPSGRESAERWLAAIRQEARAIVYECDDDIFSSGFSEHIVSSRFRQGLSDAELEQQRQDNAWFVDQCDGVTVSSEPLAAIVRGLTAKPVVVVPNAIDLRWFRAMLPPRAPWADHLTIGWAGGRRPERDIEPMAEAWGRIAERYPDVRFVVASPMRPDPIFNHVPADRIIGLRWLPFDQYPLAHMVDIGCCAVADTPFSRAKTPIKAWEYTAAGAAVVATPTLYGDCLTSAYGRVQAGHLLAETVDEWEMALSAYIEYPMDRRGTAATLREHVDECHVLDTQAHRWPDAYTKIANSA